MPDFDPSEALDAKHGRNRRERLAGIKRWVEYIREHPPEKWGKEQNALVDTQLRSARKSGLSAAHERRVRAFGEASSEGKDVDTSSE